MAQTAEKKKEIAERLLRGEDVTITMHSGDMMTDASDLETSESHLTTEGDILEGEPVSQTHSHAHHADEGSASGVPAEAVIEMMSRRIGQMAVELAVLEAKLFLAEEELRSR